jgi:hypothetical protein
MPRVDLVQTHQRSSLRQSPTTSRISSPKTQSKAVFVILKGTRVLETDSCTGACGVYSYTNESGVLDAA